MLLIAAAVVPFWWSLEPGEFARWFPTHSPRLGRLMLPLGASSTVLAVLAAALARPVASARFFWLLLAAGLAVALTYPLYFSAANRALAGPEPDTSGVAADLRRRSAWHRARTLAGVLAFLALLRGLAA